MQYKDDHIAELADHYNVAQFVSFSPGPQPAVRHARIRGIDKNPPDLASALRVLFDVTPSVNVRVFSVPATKSGPFEYGITSIDQAEHIIRRFAACGFYTIVNETIDVHDGGVSGVSLGGIIEFAPDDTPRAVERSGTVRASSKLASEFISTVYGISPEVPVDCDARVEFSIHPRPVGYHRTRTIIWEREWIEPVELPWRISWPNKFSRMIGDKVFGLLVADAIGAMVPRAIVYNRRVAAFKFGHSTGSMRKWLRTCPAEQQPGKFLTTSELRDPIDLLHAEDPTGEYIPSVIEQDSVEAKFSGATAPTTSSEDIVEGVSGYGDLFMLGERAPEPLPEDVIDDVRAELRAIKEHIGPARIEWAHDGKNVWVLQLHIATSTTSSDAIFPGDADNWITYLPQEGLKVLTGIISRATASGSGVIVAGAVGTTSHVGDLLRKSRIPSRIVAPSAE